jgi:hypothetical protein
MRGQLQWRLATCVWQGLQRVPSEQTRGQRQLEILLLRVQNCTGPASLQPAADGTPASHAVGKVISMVQLQNAGTFGLQHRMTVQGCAASDRTRTLQVRT